MLLDLLISFVLLLILVVVAVALLCAYSALPLADLINRFFRRVGLAGPSPGVRAAGTRAEGVVAGPFTHRQGESRSHGKVFAGGELWNASCPAELAATLVEGDSVDVVYGDDLTLTVLGKRGQSPFPGKGDRPAS
jgi:membrane protein implicated in regulation of membrane protease activity